MLAVGRQEAADAEEMARRRAAGEDDHLLEAEGDFPAVYAHPSRPHREDGEDEDEEVRRVATARHRKDPRAEGDFPARVRTFAMADRNQDGRRLYNVALLIGLAMECRAR